MSINKISQTVLRSVTLASVLEPISEKIGCTTRTTDWQSTSKLHQN